MFESAKSIRRYLPQNGMDATVLLAVSSGTLLSCIFEKINPSVLILFPSLNVFVDYFTGFDNCVVGNGYISSQDGNRKR